MSRLSELLSGLRRQRGMNQPQIVARSAELGVPISKGNVSRYLSGRHPSRPNEATLVAFARVFDVPVSEIIRAATDTGREPYVPDPASDKLTATQRRLVDDLIRELARTNHSQDKEQDNA